MSALVQSDERAAARRRHPCMQAPVSSRQVAERVTQALADAGAPWPRVGARVLEARGRSGLDLAAFAEHVGVPPDVLGQAEAGQVAFVLLPAALRTQLIR